MYIIPQRAMQTRLGAYPRRPRPRRYASFQRRGLSADPAIQSKYFPSTSGTAGFTTADLQKWQSAVDSGFLPMYYKQTPGDCGTPTAGKVSIPTIVSSAVGSTVLTVGGALIKAGTISGPAAPFVLAAGAALLVLGDVFGIFAGHHAAAVAKEQTELCQFNPAVNSALQAVDSGLSSGILTSAQANQALANILSTYQQSVANIMKMSGSSCNAACVYYRMLEGIVAQRKGAIAANPPPADQGPTAAATAGVTSAVASAAASTGLPAWALYAAGGLLLWKVLF